MTTLAQGNQVLNLILQQKSASVEIQNLFASGLLADLLVCNALTVDRNKFRHVIGLSPLKENESKTKHRFGDLQIGDKFHYVDKMFRPGTELVLVKVHPFEGWLGQSWNTWCIEGTAKNKGGFVKEDSLVELV